MDNSLVSNGWLMMLCAPTDNELKMYDMVTVMVCVHNYCFTQQKYISLDIGVA